VVLDKTETEQMRASSFMVLKKSHPSLMTLQVIAHSLRHEQSRQIKTLIYTSLINMATFKSHIPEIRATYVPVATPDDLFSVFMLSLGTIGRCFTLL